MSGEKTLGDRLRAGAVAWNAGRAGAPTSYVGHSVEGLSLAGADLRGLDLTGTEWTKCKLMQCDLRGADLSNSLFHRSVLEGCDLGDADLSGATIERGMLVGCDLLTTKGLASLELIDTELSRVSGLERPPKSDGMTRLHHVAPIGWGGGTLDEIVAVVSEHATVTRSGPATPEEIAAVEAALGLALPDAHRSFLATVGGLDVVGKPGHWLGALHVHGAAALERARADLRALFRPPSFPEGWLAKHVAHGAPAAAREPAAARAKLAAELSLPPELLPELVGDLLDTMRVVHALLVPAIVAPGELDRRALCVGPRGGYYLCNVERWSVEAPYGDFKLNLVSELGRVVVAD